MRIPFIGPIISTLSYAKYQNRSPQFLIVNPKKKIGYYRISKSACTSIQAGLIEELYPDIDLSTCDDHLVHILASKYITKTADRDTQQFSVVRHPVDRIISCYNDKVLKEGDDFYYYQDYLGGIIRPDMDFDEFLTMIEKIPDHLKDMHFRPQYISIPDRTEISIFRLEDQKEELSQFLKQFDIKLIHRHKTREKVLTKSMLSADHINRIVELYKKDFERFDYPIPDN